MSEENKTNEAEEVKTPAAEVETKVEEVKAPVAEVETPVEAPSTEKAPKKEKSIKAASSAEVEEEFDWEAFEKKGFGEGYSRKQRDELASVYENTLTTVEEKKVVSATIVSINDRDLVLNIGFKSDGLVGASEFRDTPG